MLIVAGVAIGFLAALVAGASLRGLAETRWRLAPLALVGMAMQAVLFSHNAALVEPILPYAPALHVITIALVLVSLVANWRISGVPLLLLGAALNFLPIALNGGQMPRQAPSNESPFRNVAPMSEETRLPFLGDWIDVPGIPGAQVSIGDLLIATGGALVAYRLTRARRVDRSAPLVLGRFPN